ncbi:hypothetical protein [Paenibacillus sp. IITD108]|uniref:hypothetical protein n=1 Tax=Paenibacillus sp. IITD108 TaxID=3116649 RepID=UPI002F404D17
MKMDVELLDRYSPIIYFDEKEPFFPVLVGATIIKEACQSPSMLKRYITFDPSQVSFVIEYAIYFDYDIVHMYELEHFWVYVGHEGEVVYAEASYHGDYNNVLLAGGQNIQQRTHVEIYSQPGKHAFASSVDELRKIPNLYQETNENAGKGGLMVPDLLAGSYNTNEEIDQKAAAYLQSFKFKPSMQFQPYRIPVSLYMEWNELAEEIPRRIKRLLSKM